MKITIPPLLITVLLFINILFAQHPKLRVAVYNDKGGGDRGTNNMELSLSNKDLYDVIRVDASDIREGVLANIDVLIQPGGSGSKQGKQLEESGRDSIREFIKRGGGYLGVCAGAYLSTSFYEWSLNILNAMVIDREHWARGSGDVVLKFTEDGKKFFNLYVDTVVVQYNQGPLLSSYIMEDIAPYKELATFKTEIAENDAPPGVMTGTTAIAQGIYGNGKVISISPHFEKREEQRIFIEKCVIWLGNKDTK
jgi:glutamine amidotransferase-like uncharacterized protein